MSTREVVYDIPERRYAWFTDVFRGPYLRVVYGMDMETAEKWGGFVSWFGGVRPRRIVYARNRRVAP